MFYEWRLLLSFHFYLCLSHWFLKTIWIVSTEKGHSDLSGILKGREYSTCMYKVLSRLKALFSTSSWSVFYNLKKKHRVLNDTKIIILFLYIAVQCYMFWKLLWKAIVYSSFDLITFPRLIASAWLCVWLCPITEYYIDDGEKSGVVRIK